MSPLELQKKLAGGLLAFPLTDFDSNDHFDSRSYTERVEWLQSFRPRALFPAAGAGEFFSLTMREFSAVTQATVQASGSLPVVASAGAGTLAAIAYAQEAQRLGADGLLLLPPYLTEGSQEGMRRHIAAVCAATDLGVIIYNRANCRLNAETLLKLAEQCPNLIGLKDGHGDIEMLNRMRTRVGDRLLLINGMPTAEIFATAYRALGLTTYSSAIFNFLPQLALDFHGAVAAQNDSTVARIMESFILPYVELRRRQPGYAVSIVKAGAQIVGRGAGKVRPPLSDLSAEEYASLSDLIAAAGSPAAPMKTDIAGLAVR
jgi:5-dehydro-4-deoxyglucarate dehydratase